jgi:hypothetical protein
MKDVIILIVCVTALVLIYYVGWLDGGGHEPQPNTTISADGDTVTIKSEGSITLHIKAKAKDGTNVDGAPIVTWDEDGGTWNWRIENGEVIEDDLVDYPKRGETQ